jgi:type IV pilus assembly protein PilW
MNMSSCYKTMRGFSLIELVIGMAIGLFLLAGVFTAYFNGRAAQAVTDDQVAMIDDARFALQTIGDDLRQAGLWGRINDFELESGVASKDLPIKPLARASLITGECVAGWADFAAPVAVFNGTSPYSSTCTSQYSAGVMAELPSDVLEIRYTLGQPVANANLQASMIYVASDVNQAAVFEGTTPPGFSVPSANMNFPLVANTYYISSWSNILGDGVPSLHKVSLEQGPNVIDQMLLAGVENLQVQYGIDTDGDGAVNVYVDPDNAFASDWQKIRSVQVWLVIRSQRNEPSLNTARTATVAGASRSFPNDGFRRYVVSTVVNLRNTKNSSGI